MPSSSRGPADRPSPRADEPELPVVKVGPEGGSSEAAAEAEAEPRPVLRVHGASGQLAHFTEPTAQGPRPFEVVGEAIPDLYDQAADALQAGRFASAIAVSSRFLEKYPHHPYADNALLLRAEARRLSGDAAGAERDLLALLRDFGDESKAPDALLALGLAHHRRGEQERARKFFDTLIDRHPQSSVIDQVPSRYLP